MPANPTTAKDMLVTSDYPLDKVVYLNSGSGSIASGGTITIAHGLSFTPLTGLVWSTTSDFSISYSDNSGSFPSGNPGFFYSLQVAVSSDSTNIYLDANGTAGSTTIYYRIFAFQPDDSNVDLPGTSSTADDFTISTDYNYSKLFEASHFTGSAGSTTTISHNIGELPKVLTWYKVGTRTYPVAFMSVDGIQTEVTTTSIIIKNNLFVSAVIYYRAYF